MRKTQEVSKYEQKIQELQAMRDVVALDVQKNVDLRIKEEEKVKEMRNTYDILERLYVGLQVDKDTSEYELEQCKKELMELVLYKNNVSQDVQDKEEKLKTLTDKLETTRAELVRQLGSEELLLEQATQKRKEEEKVLQKLRLEREKLEELIQKEYVEKQDKLIEFEKIISEQKTTLESISRARQLLDTEREKLSVEKLKIKVYAEKHNLNVEL